MSKFLVYLKDDDQEYEFYDLESAQDFIDESGGEAQLIEMLSLDTLDTDLI